MVLLDSLALCSPGCGSGRVDFRIALLEDQRLLSHHGNGCRPFHYYLAGAPVPSYHRWGRWLSRSETEDRKLRIEVEGKLLLPGDGHHRTRNIAGSEHPQNQGRQGLCC